MKSATQDRYWPDRLGSRTGGSGATVHNGLEKIWVAPSVWPMAILVCSVWRIPIFRSFRSGLANTHISVCSVWPIPKFRTQFRTVSRNFDSYSNCCLDCRVMGVLRLDRLVQLPRPPTTTTTTTTTTTATTTTTTITKTNTAATTTQRCQRC